MLYRLTTTVTQTPSDPGSNCLIEVKYNKISQLGITNGDRVRLIEVTA